RRRGWRRRRSNPPPAATSTAQPTAPFSHRPTAPAAPAASPLRPAATASSGITPAPPAPTRSSTAGGGPPLHLRRRRTRGTEGGRRAGVAAQGGRGRCPSRRRSVGALPPRRRRRQTDVETVDLSSKMQSWRSRNSVPSSSYVSVNAISQRSHSTVPVEQVLEIPPEFDPDSAEFVSDISDYATEFKRRDVLEIPLEFDPDATQLVSVERHNATKLQWEGIEIPLEFDPDSVELAPDITEYTSKLKQSHERARKLRADLAVEEQREQELSRMLKGIVTVPSLSETHKRRPRRKSSIERLRVSRHLAEEAISYFEECVSISTLDSTDFSSLEEPHQNSGGTVPRKSNSRFLLKGGSSSLESHFPTDRQNYNEEPDNQTQCSMSITGSDVSDSVIFSHAKSPGLGTRNNSSDDFDTPRSKSSCFSFTHEPVKAVDNCDIRQYLRSFSRVISKETSNYCADDYAVQKVSENRLTDMVAFKNRIEYGGLVLCNIRTF
uniref:Uncharacterized protein n=1 Tax=Aegilops tauschii subsp. strangulata TaxID=200361 RepID=A0A453KBK9_AEGTS